MSYYPKKKVWNGKKKKPEIDVAAVHSTFLILANTQKQACWQQKNKQQLHLLAVNMNIVLSAVHEFAPWHAVCGQTANIYSMEGQKLWN